MRTDKKNGKNKQTVRLDRFRRTQKETLPSKERAKVVLWQIKKVLHCHFPDLEKRLHALPDPRIGVAYRIEELVMAAIVLFMLKCDSRNDFNNTSSDKQFCKNYYQMFHLHVPGMDAVNNLFEAMAPDEFELLRCQLMNGLIEKRVFHKLRFFKNCYFCIAIDGTGAYNWGTAPPESIRPYALKKESKKDSTKKSESGKVNYCSQILEAVLVCSNGMVIPLISEWIANNGEKYFKQDCELSAFKRMAVKLKKYFPRLNVCILADGLYSNVAMMDVCRQYGWKFITVFKDGNLPSVWEEAGLLLPLKSATGICLKTSCDSTHWITYNYRWINNIEYQKHSIHWVECLQETIHRNTGEKSTHRFVFLSTHEVNRLNVEYIVKAGRARWSIEDYFNTQKNRGGALHHKFNRNDFKALKNWHNVRQLACMANELVEYTKELRTLLKENAKMTWKELWKNLNSFLTMCDAVEIIDEFELWMKMPRQVRLE